MASEKLKVVNVGKRFWNQHRSAIIVGLICVVVGAFVNPVGSYFFESAVGTSSTTPSTFKDPVVRSDICWAYIDTMELYWWGCAVTDNAPDYGGVPTCRPAKEAIASPPDKPAVREFARLIDLVGGCGGFGILDSRVPRLSPGT